MWVRTKGISKEPRLVDVSDGVIFKADAGDSYSIYFDKYFEHSVEEVLGTYKTKEERDSVFDRLSKRLNEREGAIFL